MPIVIQDIMDVNKEKKYASISGFSTSVSECGDNRELAEMSDKKNF